MDKAVHEMSVNIFVAGGGVFRFSRINGQKCAGGGVFQIAQRDFFIFPILADVLQHIRQTMGAKFCLRI
jgi:hypothetical protein